MNARFTILLTLALTLSGGCVSLADHVATARLLDDAVVTRAMWPADAAWVAIADGEASPAASMEEAHQIAPLAPHRYVFQPAEAGDTRPRMAYLPASALIAGREFATKLGLTLRRDARGSAILTRGEKRVAAEAGGSLLLRISAPDGSAATTAAVLLDPDFRGPLLISPPVAETLGLRRFEVPGRAHVDVALGRPFSARRARVLITIEELGVSGLVEALCPH